MRDKDQSNNALNVIQMHFVQRYHLLKIITKFSLTFTLTYLWFCFAIIIINCLQIGKVNYDGERRHNKGCNCKRSGCLKNYCECYEAKIGCTKNCRCIGCKNVEVGTLGRRPDGGDVVGTPSITTKEDSISSVYVKYLFFLQYLHSGIKSGENQFREDWLVFWILVGPEQRDL